MGMSVLVACMHVYLCVPGAHGNQETATDLLEMKLQMIVVRFLRQHKEKKGRKRQSEIVFIGAHSKKAFSSSEI